MTHTRTRGFCFSVGDGVTQRACAALMAMALNSVLAPLAVAAEEPMVNYTVRSADTLIHLSRKVFASEQAWREIAALNRLPNPNRVYPGQVLRVPERLVRMQPASATVTSVVGDVRINEAPAKPGMQVAEGQRLKTQEGGSIVIRLDDGSRVKLPPSSLAEVLASRRFGVGKDPQAEPGWFIGTLRLLQGSVEVLGTKVLRAKPLEVTTPTATVGVRGTNFRVTAVDPAMLAGGATRTEVLSGVVLVDAPSATAASQKLDEPNPQAPAPLASEPSPAFKSLVLNKGFGAVVQPGVHQAPKATALLPAPSLKGLPERFERPLVRFRLKNVQRRARVQVAKDAAFDQIVVDQLVAAGAEVRLAGLVDGRWHVRARQIDESNLEGYDVATSFLLKARPEPPASIQPRAASKQSAGEVLFAWAPNVDAQYTRLQVSQNPQFAKLVFDRADLTAAEMRVPLTEPGAYYWRTASIKRDGDVGPFGDAQAFELRPNPEPPKGGIAADGKSLVLSWSARAEDRQQVQLARDSGFKNIVSEAELRQAEWKVPTPDVPGRYYFRYRSIEPDGYVTPYSSTLTIELPRDWRQFLFLGLPLFLIF
jgi:hypothetical protein